MAHVDSVKEGSFEPSALQPDDTLSSLTHEERAAHDLPDFETADPTRPILYLPPLLSKLPPKYDKNDEEDQIPHDHLAESGPLQTETHLPSIDPVSLSLHRALHKFKPLDDKYAGTPYGVSFNWAQLELPEDEERDWYCVAFRSRRKPGSDSGPLYEQDRLAHEEAVQNGGILMYWYGVPDPKTGMNLATCIWQSRRHAVGASSGPQHILAMKLAVASFAEYRLERWVLRKVKGRTGLFVDAYEGGDVGW